MTLDIYGQRAEKMSPTAFSFAHSNGDALVEHLRLLVKPYTNTCVPLHNSSTLFCPRKLDVFVMVCAAVCTALHSVVKLFRSLYFRWKFVNSYVDLWQGPCHTVSFCVVCRARRTASPASWHSLPAKCLLISQWLSPVNLLLFTAATMLRDCDVHGIYIQQNYIYMQCIPKTIENDPRTRRSETELFVLGADTKNDRHQHNFGEKKSKQVRKPVEDSAQRHR